MGWSDGLLSILVIADRGIGARNSRWIERAVVLNDEADLEVVGVNRSIAW